MVFEDRVLKRIFGSKSEEVGGVREHCTMRSFINFTLHQILIVCSNLRG